MSHEIFRDTDFGGNGSNGFDLHLGYDLYDVVCVTLDDGEKTTVGKRPVWTAEGEIVWDGGDGDA